ncbi:unnamed protein product [Protopolystoma xenopodis]|uniref:Saccharopine dehydrogenase NADP binding domain-containing protein n=1 Tax=Protopolystoma xenopodis TaxID=117903 RepID=A0A3S5C2X7_9PLAT|nr:unnamed protein product [Protopolystoma xenopodis]
MENNCPRNHSASNSKADLFSVCDQFNQVRPEEVDVLKDEARVDELISKTDLVVSMVPWVFHPVVMRYCIKHKKNILTASYYTPGLVEMEKE